MSASGMQPRSRPARPSLGGPSPTLVRWAHKLSDKRLVLDAGCGTGRNAVALARLGHKIVCADNDAARLRQLAGFASNESIQNSIFPVCVDLASDNWPFGRNFFAAVLCVHYLDLKLLPLIQDSLCRGGCLFIETIDGQGENQDTP